MKNHFNLLALFLITIVWIFSCKSKTVEPDLSALFEIKTDEFIKVEIDGKQFDYRTVLKTDYQEALKIGRTTNMFECAGCKNSMVIFFGQKNPSSTTPFSWSTNIERATTNLLVDANTPIFYVGFRFDEKIDAANYRSIYTARTANLEGDWGDPVGNMIVKIISNENGIVKGTFSGKNLDGKEIKNGTFSLRYKL
jgi:hypothetical protein